MSSGSTPRRGPLDDIEALPLRQPDDLARFGKVMIVAPHQDDETLGCGGLIALLRRANQDVEIVFTSDGTGSHPNSRKFPSVALRDLREAEALAAASVLGVDAGALTFLRLQDTKVPHPGDGTFDAAVEMLSAVLVSGDSETIAVPWRRDPHIDHRGTWHIVNQAVVASWRQIRVIEYPIWVWDLGQPGDLPEPGEMHGWRIDISSVLDLKIEAIEAYRSQTTGLIDDDPDGFRLQPETLAHFRLPWEIFLEPADV